MDSIFTLPYSEFAVADVLNKQFKPNQGYSIFVPLSRTEKGVDLMLTHKRAGEDLTVSTIQVKASRAYLEPSPTARARSKKYKYNLWFNRFDVSERANFFVLFAIYPDLVSVSNKDKNSGWKQISLLFTFDEMYGFMNSIVQKSGKPEKMFGFGFDEPETVFLTRGRKGDQPEDYSEFLLENRLGLIYNHLGAVKS